MKLNGLIKRISLFTVVMLAMAAVFMVVAAPSSVSDRLSASYVSIDAGSGYCTGMFSEFSGIGSENEIVQRNITSNKGAYAVQNIPGKFATEKMVIKRNATNDMGFYNWRKLVEDGNITAARKNVTVTLYDSSGIQKAVWNLTNAWPCSISYEFADMAVIETIAITYEKMQRVQ